MAYKTLKLTVDSNMVDYHIGLISYALEDMDGVELEIRLKNKEDKVQIKAKVIKFTREYTWQTIATAISQKIMGITVLLPGQPAAIYDYGENVVLRQS